MPTTQSDTDWLRIALVVLAAFVLLPLVSMAVMMPMMGMGMWGW